MVTSEELPACNIGSVWWSVGAPTIQSGKLAMFKNKFLYLASFIMGVKVSLKKEMTKIGAYHLTEYTLYEI